MFIYLHAFLVQVSEQMMYTYHYCEQHILSLSEHHSFIHIIITNYFIWVCAHIVLESFKTAPTLISKSHLWFFPLFSHISPLFLNEDNRAYNTIQIIHTISSPLKNEYQSNQPLIHPWQPYMDGTQSKNSNCHEKKGIGYSTALDFYDLAWRSNIARCISLGGNNAYIDLYPR